jgi:uncharacterized protein YbbC (DUF1343 family)
VVYQTGITLGMRPVLFCSLISLILLSSCFQSRKLIKEDLATTRTFTGSEVQSITEVNDSLDVYSSVAAYNANDDHSRDTKRNRESRIKTGAERTGRYFGRLRQHQKRVAVVANHTSMIGNVHLVDSMLNSGINLIKIFTPEHGFRGFAGAGEELNNETDPRTGLPIISLYGKQKKPLPTDLADVDIVVFDMQDVGVRFYTYISTMSLVMEACAENNIPFLILDRPNPNGFYVDGPVLETTHSSFVGMHPVPIVHGMTMAEYARMVNEEGWLKGGIKCDLDWVPCSGYTHSRLYELPVKPSPNLPDMTSVILYPTTCLFEGTKASVGRGTDYPFRYIGYPALIGGKISFTPVSRPGATNPPYKNQVCYGFDFSKYAESIREKPGIRLSWIINMYKADTTGSSFFTSFFTNLAGTDKLQKQIEAGMDEHSIRESWQKPLQEFLKKRDKYLIYKDF